MLLNGDSFVINEKKTGKRRQVKINKDFQKHIKDCLDALQITNDNQKCFISQKKVVFSTQRINVLFKEIKSKYHLKVEHFSTHSMRKTFGRKVYESAGSDAAMALMRLSELFEPFKPTYYKGVFGHTTRRIAEYIRYAYVLGVWLRRSGATHPYKHT